jgi:putative FmdB family regulatory protein
MPTYEYLCPVGHSFEKFQKMTDSPKARCPECGKMATRQISGGAGLVFKGSGFYITDYGKDGKGPRKAEKSEKSEKSEASGKGATGDTPAKPEKKAEPRAEATKPPRKAAE